jgi:hypothetical protein
MSAHVKGTGAFAYRTHPPDLFTPRDPEPDVRAGADVLDRMAEERREWLDRMRHVLVQVYGARVMTWGEGHPMTYVCADDADRLAKWRPELALPAGASPNLMGSVFRTPEWEAIDRTHVSSQPGSHGNLLTRWRYVGKETP